MATGPYEARDAPASLPINRPLQQIHLRRRTKPLPCAITCARDAARLVLPHVKHAHREMFFSLPLDSRHRPIGLHIVSVGSPNSAPVHPREVFLPAVLSCAVALIVLHNHPSGDPTPSTDDRLITERLRQAGDLLGIEVLDHIVLGDGRIFSFADESVLPMSP